MKCTPLMIALLIPAAAIASQDAGEQNMDHQQLRNHVRASHILGAEVQSDSGQDMATVEDLVFDQQGSIVSVIVQREDRLMTDEWDRDTVEADQNAELDSDMERAAERAGDAVERGAETSAAVVDSGVQEAGEEWQEATGDDARVRGTDMAEVRAERRERTGREGNGMSTNVDTGRAGALEGGDAFAALQWGNVSYNGEEQVLRVSSDAFSGLQAVQYDQSSARVPQSDIRASELIGLEIHLADEESFGEVEDVMIDAANGRASALIVDTMEFFDKERYALPIELAALNRENESLTLQLTQQQVEAMGEFEMDAAATR